MQSLTLCLKGDFMPSFPLCTSWEYFCQTSCAKPNAYTRISGFIHKGKILHHVLFCCMMIYNPRKWYATNTLKFNQNSRLLLRRHSFIHLFYSSGSVLVLRHVLADHTGHSHN